MKSTSVASLSAAPSDPKKRPSAEQAPGAGGRNVKTPDSEKITINLGHVDLGQVDLLVNEGFYGNRTDFIRTAIRNQLTQHADALKQVVARKMFVFGIQHISRHDLEQLQEARQKLTLRVVGLATIATDVTPELALATIDTLEVLGALHASSAVKQALATRIQ
ncbi:MAG: CopG family transcriptional regulator [Burkholderiaceae bacterium]|nr:CopG family transcriptional regulator [Burkholderiaceae bacterium]